MPKKAKSKNIAERVAGLGEDEREGLQTVIYHLLTMLESGNGGSVTIIDEEGDGRVSVMALGMQELVSPLLGIAGAINDTMYEPPTGTIQ